MNDQISMMTNLIRKSENEHHGKYHGIVKDNADPKKRGRIMAIVPKIKGNDPLGWMPGLQALGGNAEEMAIFVPAIGCHVVIEFIDGDLASPIYTGTYFPNEKGDGKETSKPHESFDLAGGTLHQFRTRSGIEIRLEDDGADHVEVKLNHPGGGYFHIDSEGIITLSDGEKSTLLFDPKSKIGRLDSYGNVSFKMEEQGLEIAFGSSKIVLDNSGVKIDAPKINLDGEAVNLGKGASSPLLNAQAFAATFDAHVHAPPSSPPAPPLNAMLQAISLIKVKGV